jgi:hypothetical protein
MFVSYTHKRCYHSLQYKHEDQENLFNGVCVCVCVCVFIIYNKVTSTVSTELFILTHACAQLLV